ncbi:MAG: hypothetical protein IPN76_15415 [Saprospiraceae bacterium]|nr:hypothetical protein [Saprospiraceae bacterium]
MKLRLTFVIAFCIGAVASTFSQISISVQSQPSTCSSNGSIQITTSGGTGTINYELAGPCLPSPIFQQLSSFNNLPPCQYTIVVTDGGTGASASQSVTVGGNYQSPDISLFCGSCQLEASTNGGLAPFTYSMSTAGLGGPFTNNAPSSNPIFTNISSGTNYWIKVTDACGNVSVETCQSGEGSITDFTWEVGQDGSIHVLSVTGGNGALIYELNSDAGMFSNSAGVFPPSQWGCNMSLTVLDGCAMFTKNIKLKPVIKNICTNFAEGTATIQEVIGGVAPYALNYVSPDGVVTSTTSNTLTGLPINAGYYLFKQWMPAATLVLSIFKQKKYPCSNKSLWLNVMVPAYPSLPQAGNAMAVSTLIVGPLRLRASVVHPPPPQVLIVPMSRLFSTGASPAIGSLALKTVARIRCFAGIPCYCT